MTLPCLSFSERLVRVNNLDAAGFAAWDFLPGMRFGGRAAWWREGAERELPHEGLDIGWFHTRDGRRLPLGVGARVPVIWQGVVVAITPDFLGRSVFVAHDRLDAEGRRLHTVYGHIDPRPRLAPGDPLREGSAIGVIADASRRKTAVPSHLHVTIALIAREGGPTRLDWNALRDRSRVILLDPEPILCCGHASGPR